MEIAGIGTDIEEISRFAKILPATKKRVFTSRETAYCDGKAEPSQHLAGKFAAKEAVVKSLGSAGVKTGIRDIEIINSDEGPPRAVLPNNLVGKYEALVSISHSGDMALAFSVLLKK
jgi:holo-[acyl-carrier protein] synthase